MPPNDTRRRFEVPGIAAADDRHPPTPDRRRLRILLINDSEEEADPLLRALGRGGVDPVWERVETADGLRAALASKPWDVVLSDYALPGFGAPAALAVVRGVDPDLPFVVVSGAVDEDAAVELMRASASDYVLKHDLGRLAPTVEREVRESGNRRARLATGRAAALLAAVVESSNDAIASENLAGVLTSWNPAAERLYGWTAAEAVGRQVSFLVPSDKAAERAGMMDRVRAGERVEHFETVRLHRDGRRIDISLTMSPVRGPEGRLLGVSKTGRDIRDRKQAEEDLRLFRALIDQATDGIEVIDPDTGRFLDANERACIAHGYTRQEYLRLSVADVDPFVATLSWAEVIKSRRLDAVQSFESTHRRRDGSTFPVEVNFTPIRLDRDYMVAVVRDITARKRADADRVDMLARMTLQVERMPLAYMLTDADSRCIRWNPAAERIFGFTEAEALGKRPFELIVPPQSWPVVAAVFERAKAGDMHAHSTNENVTKDGGPSPASGTTPRCSARTALSMGCSRSPRM